MKGIVDEIITSINDSIIAATAEAKFAGKLLYGITERRSKADIIAPSVVNQEGRIEPIFLNSKIPLLVFHKINGTSFDYNIQESFGRGMTTRATHNMSMLVFTMKTKTGLNGIMLEQLIEKSMPSTWTAAFKKKLALKSLNTKIASCDHDAGAIYKREWIGVKDPFIIPESSLIEVRYQIVRTYKGDCAVNCCN